MLVRLSFRSVTSAVGGRDNLLLCRSLRKRRIRLLLSLTGGALGLARLLLELLNYSIARLQFLIELLDLLLLCADRLLHFFQAAQILERSWCWRPFSLQLFVAGRGCTLWGRGCKCTGGERKRQGQSHAFLHFSSVETSRCTHFSGAPTGTAPERE